MDHDPGLDVGAFALAVEAFNEVFIRLPNLEKLSFTTLANSG